MIIWQLNKNAIIDAITMAKVTADIKVLMTEYTYERPYKMVIDLSAENCKISQEAMNYISENVDVDPLKLKEAIIVNSYMKSLLIGVYMRINKPKTPTKSFSSMEKALEWIY